MYAAPRSCKALPQRTRRSSVGRAAPSPARPLPPHLAQRAADSAADHASWDALLQTARDAAQHLGLELVSAASRGQPRAAA